LATSSPSPERDRPGAIAPPPLIFLAVFALGWLLARFVVPPLDVPHGVAIGAVLFVAGLALMIWAAATMTRARTTFNPYGSSTAIVTTGPFRWTRNPIYVADAVVYAGMALLLHAVAALLLLPLALIVITLGVVRREERYLERKFGASYLAYRRRVRRWL